MVRTQIYLTDEEERVLARLARERGTTKAQLIRDAIDTAYLEASGQQALIDALSRSAGAWKRKEGGAAYVERLRSGKLARLHAADRR